MKKERHLLVKCLFYNSPFLFVIKLAMTTTKYAALYPAVAARSTELVQIIVHGAANVPTLDDRLPDCYVIM